MDEQIMSWAVQRPEDWQLGGRCEAFMWGGGRIGQLGEAGRNVLVPTAAQSFSCAQQVTSHACLLFSILIFALIPSVKCSLPESFSEMLNCLVAW